MTSSCLDGSDALIQENFVILLRIVTITWHARPIPDWLAEPSLFAADLQSGPSGSWVLVDQIQRLPSFLNEVHRLIEDRRLKFALLGPSWGKLKADCATLLAGRSLHKTVHPPTRDGLGDDFDLDAAFNTGTIPLV